MWGLGRGFLGVRSRVLGIYGSGCGGLHVFDGA